MRVIDLENINYAMRSETQFVLRCEEAVSYTHLKQKDPKPYGFGSFWHAVRDSNPRPSGP